MQGKELTKYGAVFGAGVLTVFAAIGVNSLFQPGPQMPQPAAADPLVATEQLPTEQAPTESVEVAPDEASSVVTPQSSKQASPNQPGTSSSSQPAKTNQIGAGTTVPGVTNIGDLVRNTMVTLEGTVTRINDEDEFTITDATGSVQVYTGRTLFTVEQGQSVSVRGLVDDGVLLEIYASSITLPDGSVVEIRHW
jgi:uncharacterized protein YdeI (BOF family)